MNEPIFKLKISNLETADEVIQYQATDALEHGKVVYCPELAFAVQPDETILLNEAILARGHKNVSYDINKQKISGIDAVELQDKVVAFMQRFSSFSHTLIEKLFPSYQDHIRWGRTSYRPAEIDGRITSKRKDDTRVHVDAFPSTPVQGARILRVFCNINPYKEPRVWHIGQPFPEVLDVFSKHLPPYNALKAHGLKFLNITKSYRTAYDHYMLHLHDSMKLNDDYQKRVVKYRMDFPAHSTWIVLTDQVSHAALKGQFLLEQTFYLPVDAMQNPQLSPLKQWESRLSWCNMANC